MDEVQWQTWLTEIFIILIFTYMDDSEKVLNQARKMRGYLQKRSSGLISIWQRRYFIILDKTLSYYADETLQELKKSIPITQINQVKVLEDTEFHLVTNKRVYQLKSDTVSNRDLWVASLNILINYKDWSQANPKKHYHTSDKKTTLSRPHSKQKKFQTYNFSPPAIKKHPSIRQSKTKLEDQFSAEKFFYQIQLYKISNGWKEQGIRNKIVLIKLVRACYFIISCKTLLHSHEDEDFLTQDFVYPYQFNTLYYYEFGKEQLADAVEICKCSDISNIQESHQNILLVLTDRTITIELDYKKIEIVDCLSVVKKIKHAALIGREYHNPANIKIKRNIDKMLFKYDSKEISISEIVKREVEKCYVENKEANPKQQFRKNLQNMKKTAKQIINCCDALGKSRLQFKQRFIKDFHDHVLNYIHKTWGNLHKVLTLIEQKKILLILYDFWKIVKDVVKDNKMFQGSISMHNRLLQKYQEEIISKMNSCFALKENQILDQISIEIKGQTEDIDQLDTIFYSNILFRQFHIDIRLVLHQFLQMPIHQKILQSYLTLFQNVFKHITETTFKYIGKWKNVNLILGTCNQIQFIKNSLFEQMYSKLTKEYKPMANLIQNKYINELQNDISSTQIILVKNLFVATFSTIDRTLLIKNFDELKVSRICEQIIEKLKIFAKINKYVKKNIFQASFEEICYFYYTSIIKFNRKAAEKQYNAQFFIKKISEDVKIIGQFFETHIYSQKIYAHLKDLALLKQFIQTDVSQIKKICQSLKKQFGNSFTEVAVFNLLNLRDMSDETRDNLALECNQIVKNSAETPEQISMMSSSRQSFLDNWNNTRSRKSTLTLSLNQFYENQHTIHHNKYTCSVWKQGYLNKRKIIKNSSLSEVRAYYKINHCKLQEYESQVHEEATTAYELNYVKRCYLHPDKNYTFMVEFNDFKLQFKAETSDEAKEWIKNINEERGVLTILKELPLEKERASQGNILDLKDPSTMESFKIGKERSREKSIGSPLRKGKKEQERSKGSSPEKIPKLSKQQKQLREVADESCYKCSKGFFF